MFCFPLLYYITENIWAHKNIYFPYADRLCFLGGSNIYLFLEHYYFSHITKNIHTYVCVMFRKKKHTINLKYNSRSYIIARIGQGTTYYREQEM